MIIKNNDNNDDNDDNTTSSIFEYGYVGLVSI